jgi:hypothetical protein
LKSLGSTLLLLGACAVIAPSLHATVSFAGSGGQNFAGPGVTKTFTDSSGAFQVTASAWSSSYNVSTGAVGNLAGATMGQYNPYGLSDCDSAEISDCTSPNHAIDNSGRADFILLQISTTLSSIQLTLNPFATAEDMDATVITGLCSGTCTASTFFSAINGGTIAPTQSSVDGIAGTTNVALTPYPMSGTRSTPITINLTGLNSGVNFILIGASTLPNLGGDGVADFFKLQSLGTPEPATFGLAGAALLGIAVLQFRKKRTANS